jgi:predicted O-linked N-acetylglucosamine transferase (SPINDLY family)
MLKWKSFTNRSVRERYKRLFTRHGVVPERLDFREETSPYLMQLEYGEVDIALDPFPFSGGLTTYQALWMGVPVISLPGQTPISRQAAAILRELGLSHLVAGSVDEYIDTAANLAFNREMLERLRTTIRPMLAGSKLTDVATFTRNLEGLYDYAHAHGPQENYLAAPTMDSLEKAAKECNEAGQSVRASEILEAIKLSRRMSTPLKILAANIAFDQGKRQKAINMLHRITNTNTDQSVLMCLGTLLRKMNRFHESRLAFERSLAVDLNFSPAHYCLAGNVIESGMFDKGFRHLEQALKLSKYSLGAIVGYLLSINYSDSFSPQELFNIHRQYAAKILKQGLRRYKGWNNSAEPDRKLKIGFLSGDLGMHPVSFFLVRSFQYHDRSTISVAIFGTTAIAGGRYGGLIRKISPN